MPRRRQNSGEGSIGLCAPMEGGGFPRGGSWPPSHARMRRLEAQPQRRLSAAARGRKKGRIGAACGGGGATVLGWDRKGMEELVGRRPWSFHGRPWPRAGVRGKSEHGVELKVGTTFSSGPSLGRAPSTRGAEARSMATACPFGAHCRTPGVH